MPILVPKHQRVSENSGHDGTKSEQLAYGFELLIGSAYATNMATTGAWDVVYFQAPNGALRQARWYGSWTVTEIVPAGKALLRTPLASIMWGPQNTFRLYYLSPEFELREWCLDSNDSKYDGALNAKKVKVAPYSKISAICFKGPELRVYYQGDNNKIEEYCFGSQGWTKGATMPGDALPGTSLAYINRNPVDQPTPSIRGYFQTISGGLAEYVWESGSGWQIGDFKTKDAPFLTPIAATVSQEKNFPKMFIFWLSVDETILQATNYKGWSNPVEVDTVSVAPSSNFAATSFARDDGSVDVRIYGTNQLNTVAGRVFRGGKWEKEIVNVKVGKEVVLEVVGA